MDISLLSAVFESATADSRHKKIVKHSARELLMMWLEQLTPFNSGGNFPWDEYVQDFASDPESAPEYARQSKILFLITFHTFREKYLLLIKEAFDFEVADPMYIMAVTVALDEEVVRAKRALRKSYEASSGEKPPADVSEIRTVWAENFTPEKFQRTLDRAAVAILGNELDSRKFVKVQRPNKPVETPESVHEDLEVTVGEIVRHFEPPPPTGDDIVRGFEKMSDNEKRKLLKQLKDKAEHFPAGHRKS
jgi:hypothetical protein